MLAMPFEELHTALSRGVASAIFPVGVSAERNDRFDFTEPLLSTGGGLFTKVSDGAAMPTLEALHGKVVTTPIAGPLYRIIQRNAPAIDLLSSGSYEESFQQLIEGRAAAAALNIHVGKAMVEQHYAGSIRVPSETFVALPMAVAVSRGEKRWLVEALDLALREIRSEDPAKQSSTGR